MRGLNQTTAAMAATALTVLTFGAGYGVMRLLAKRALVHAEHEGLVAEGASATHDDHTASGGDHGDNAAAGHGGASPGEPSSSDGSDHSAHGSSGREGDQGGHGATAAPHWAYQGSSGPPKWGDLGEGFRACSIGKAQSPVDIEGDRPDSKLLPLRFQYRDSEGVVVNNGHTIQMNMKSGNYVEVDGERFDLVQFHFHLPSEHKVAGVPYDLELHFVHKNADGKLAVVGLLYEEGHVNSGLAPVWNVLPNSKGAESDPVPLNPEILLPARRTYWHYQGSLTTPPCSEGVRWFVLTQPLEVSAKQLEMFHQLYPLNARPVQPLAGRTIKKSAR